MVVDSGSSKGVCSWTRIPCKGHAEAGGCLYELAFVLPLLLTLFYGVLMVGQAFTQSFVVSALNYEVAITQASSNTISSSSINAFFNNLFAIHAQSNNSIHLQSASLNPVSYSEDRTITVQSSGIMNSLGFGIQQIQVGYVGPLLVKYKEIDPGSLESFQNYEQGYFDCSHTVQPTPNTEACGISVLGRI
ncbi:MAG: hypothetical protein D6719_09740 [Candidatus Dadabacteria bacterium]|nr:MAG: hypothetical protein D6719_09740 [Candidatus Dadabacteria bacterium]